MSGCLKPLIAHIPKESFVKVIYKNKAYAGIILNIENDIPDILSLIDTDTDEISIISNDNRISKNNELFINDYQVQTFGPGINATITTLLKKWAYYGDSVEFTAPKGIPPLKDLTEKKGDIKMGSDIIV